MNRSENHINVSIIMDFHEILEGLLQASAMATHFTMYQELSYTNR